MFSQQAEAVLNASRGFRTLAGRAVEIDAGDKQVVVTIEYGHERERVAYDMVVVAVGFHGRWFETLLGDEARRRLGRAEAGAGLERRIDVDLSVAGLNPPLHLPVLAGLAQGPGFPNLSCLGLLSDRILRRYVPSGPPGRIDRERKHVTEVPDEAWESDDYVRRTVVMPTVLAERLAARAEQRGLSVSDLLAEYAEEGLRRDGHGT